MSNSTEQRCFKVVSSEVAPPLLQNGKIVFQAFYVGWIISGSFALIAMFTSGWLINKHLQWYTDKKEQRYIVRLLFMVPVYALISFGSFIFWNHATPIILIRDAYEAIVLTAFFYLLLAYLSHDVEEQKRIFLRSGLSLVADAVALKNGKKPRKWIIPLGFVRWKPRDGLYFLQLMKWGVLQYCVVRPTTTLAAVILNYVGLYCESSYGFGWGHIYITVIVSVSVSVAMYCLIQLYFTVSNELAPHKPLLKLFSVKAVVFLTFWQATFISMLSMFGIVKAEKYMTAEDVDTGIGSIIETLEMMIFAFIHIRAFSYVPYKDSQSRSYQGLPLQTPRWRSLGHAMDFRETFREIWVGCVYMFDRIRGKETRVDFGVIREAHYESAFGRQRPLPGWKQRPLEHAEEDKSIEATFPTLEVEVSREVDVKYDSQAEWLLPSKSRWYKLGVWKRENSESLQERIDRELEMRGFPRTEDGSRKPEIESPVPPPVSWWRHIYNRISQDDSEPDKHESFYQSLSRFSSYRRHDRRKFTELDYNDPLPQGLPNSRKGPGHPPRRISNQYYNSQHSSNVDCYGYHQIYPERQAYHNFQFEPYSNLSPTPLNEGFPSLSTEIYAPGSESSSHLMRTRDLSSDHHRPSSSRYAHRLSSMNQILEGTPTYAQSPLPPPKDTAVSSPQRKKASTHSPIQRHQSHLREPATSYFQHAS